MQRSHKPASMLHRPGIVFALVIVMAASGIVLSFVGSNMFAELNAPKAPDRQVALLISALLREDHLSKRGLDDEMSHRCLTSFLKTLDPMKIYFLQSDVAEFQKDRDNLDDMLLRGDISFGHRVFKRYLQRVDERMKDVDELLKGEFDFTLDEKIVIDPDAARYAVDAKEAKERWRKRLKLDILALKASSDDDKKKDEDPIERLTRRYHSFAKRTHQTDNDELLEMYLTSMTTSFDPHTTYMSPSTLENFHISMKLNLDGIGAALQSEDGYTKVTKVIPGGAADRAADLKAEDRIVSVGQGEEGDLVDVIDMKLGDVVKLIRGKRGTTVRLGVIPDGKTETKVYLIVRAKIELKDSEARGVVFEAGKKENGMPYKIGMIDLPSFYMDMSRAKEGRADFKSTTRDVQKILLDFRTQGVDGVVLDLRRNGGGSLTEAITLTGLFVDHGPVVQVKDTVHEPKVYEDRDAGMAWNGPLVVLTSKFSASASEILAGAIQDYQRGLIVGDRATHGKGTVQSLLNLGRELFQVENAPNLGALKITMQKFYRPNGDSTQVRGVLADVELPSITNHMDVSESDLDHVIKWDAVKPATYHKTAMVSNNMLAQLKAASLARQEASEDFAKLNRRIKRYRERKDREYTTLNEEAFLAERAELEADDDKDEDKDKDEEEKDEVIIDRTFYVDEALDLTVDYIRLLGGEELK